MNKEVVPAEKMERINEDSISTKRLKAKLTRELGILRPYLDQDDVQELFVNPDGNVFVIRAGHDKEKIGVMNADDVDGFLASVASSLHTTITRASPTIDGMLIIDGSRISGEIPPIVSGPSMRIRKHAKTVMELNKYVEQGGMTEDQISRIREAIKATKNIVVVGGTGSGKTFLANSILREMSMLMPSDRILTIEDTPELNVVADDHVSWYITDDVPMQKMLHRALRATPDRIVVGEVRGGEAYQLLKMWNTGHSGGICTIHSDKGDLDGLMRLERMCGESDEAKGMPKEWLGSLIGNVVHVLVNIVKLRGGERVIHSIVEVTGFNSDTQEYEVNVFRKKG